jgi:hypothetical protein
MNAVKGSISTVRSLDRDWEEAGAHRCLISLSHSYLLISKPLNILSDSRCQHDQNGGHGRPKQIQPRLRLRRRNHKRQLKLQIRDPANLNTCHCPKSKIHLEANHRPQFPKSLWRRSDLKHRACKRQLDRICWKNTRTDPFSNSGQGRTTQQDSDTTATDSDVNQNLEIIVKPEDHKPSAIDELEAIKLLLKEKQPTKIVGVESQRIEKILKIIDKYMIIVDVAIQQSPNVTALVWAGARLTVQV